MRQSTLAIVLALASCEKKPAEGPPAATTDKREPRPTAPLIELSTASTLGPVRAAFNAHKGEARFLTLLSPT